MKQILSQKPFIVVCDNSYELNNALNSPFLLEELNHCKTNKRKEEIMFTRGLLINELNILEFEKDENGRPFIEKGDISISHSKGTFGIAYSESKKIGFDIEKISEKPRRIKHKFQNEDELIFDVSDEELTRLWTIKEAVYKYLNNPGVLFAEEIWVSKLNNQFIADYKVNDQLIERIQIQSEKVGECMISYTL